MTEAAAAATRPAVPRLGQLPARLLGMIAALVLLAFAVGLVIGLVLH